MNRCIETDALVAIGDALKWDLSEGLRHLQTCDDCRADLEALRESRAALSESEVLPAEVLQRVGAAIGTAARAESHRRVRRGRWMSITESVAAGITALFVVVSSGVDIESIGAAALAFGLGAALMSLGRVVERRTVAST